jgi:hypothetical protein
LNSYVPWRDAVLSIAILGACAVGVAAGKDSDATLEGALTHCAAIRAGDDRLACYDALATGRTPIVAPPSPTAAPAPAPIPTKEDFGLSTVQKQKTQPSQKQIESINASVTGFGTSAIGRVLVGLDNGQSWELDAADPLLAVGDAVVIRRGAMGSFLLMTPSQRTHHVRRVH